MGKVKEQFDRDRYKLIADKIMQLLDKIHDTSLSEKRWVWELMQNAKDVPNKFDSVSVKIELFPDRLIFSHNGDHFTVNNLSGLIQQVSSKDSKNQGEQTGKFGTGFITTHLLSRAIEVKGIVLNDNTGRYQHFNILLDRSAKSSEELIPVISSSIRHVERLDDGDIEKFPIAYDYENRSEEDFCTSFTYKLNADSLLAAQKGLDDLVNTLPITMVSLSKLKSVRVINHINNTDDTYFCDSKVLSEADGTSIKDTVVTISGNSEKSRRYYTYRNSSVALSMEYTLNAKGAICLIERNEGQPVLFRDFPLIGSDKFYFPYMLNGFHFEPTEMRDGLLLNKNEEKAVLNRSIVDEAVKAALNFNEWLLGQKVSNTYLLASSRKPIPINTWDEEYAKPWINKLQENWRAKLLSQILVETTCGYSLLKELRLPSFEDNSLKHDERFYDFANGFMKEGILPLKSQLKNWRSVINQEYESWKAKLKYTKSSFLKELETCKTLDGLTKRLGSDIQDAIRWMKELVDFLIEADIEQSFKSYAIFPDGKGNFHRIEELQNDAKEPIPTAIREIYDILLCKDIESTLLHDSLLECQIDTASFGFKEAVDAINKSIESKLSNYSRYRIDKDLWRKDLNAVMRMVNAFNPDEGKNDINIRMQELVAPLLEDGFIKDEIKGLDSSFWSSAHRFVLSMLPRKMDWEYSSLDLFRKNFFRVELEKSEAIDWMNLMFSVINEVNLSIPKDLAIYPDENGTFHRLQELHFDKSIPREYKSLDMLASNRDWNKELLHDGLQGFENHQPYETATVYESIKKSFESTIPLSKKQEIALQAISIIPVSISAKHAAVDNIYSLAKVIFEGKLPGSVEISSTNGFEWEKFASFILEAIAEKIAENESLEEFAKKFSLQKDEAFNFVDRVIEYAETYYDKRHRNIVEERHGVWINQHEHFIPFKEIHLDSKVATELKNIALNKHVDHDFRSELADMRGKFIKYLPEETAISAENVLRAIDAAIRNYVEEENGNLQQSDFTQLVLDLHSWNDKYHDDKQYTPYFDSNHDRLMVGSLTEKETISLIGKLVGSKDKLTAAAELIDRYSADQIRFLHDDNETLKNENERLKTRILELEAMQAGAIIGGCPYGGLSDEQKKEYSIEARQQICKALQERGYEFTRGIGETSIVPGIVKDGITYPLVAKSHRSNAPIELNPLEWIELSKENAMLWVYFGNDESKPVSINELLRKQDKLTLSFESDNLVDDKRLLQFAQILRYFKNLHFDIESLAPESVSDKLGGCLDFNRKTERIIDEANHNDLDENL